MVSDEPFEEDRGTLFDAPDGSDTIAYLMTGAGDWDAYAEAYKLGAETLVEHIRESRMHLDLLVFPIVFLYRQYLELRLKELIEITTGLNSEDRREHHLARLWRRVRPALEGAFPENSDDFDAAEKMVKDFQEADAGSFTFRYPEDKAGEPTLPPRPKGVRVGPDGAPMWEPPPPGPKLLDLGRLREEMGDLAELLDGCSIGIYESKRAE